MTYFKVGLDPSFVRYLKGNTFFKKEKIASQMF